MIYEWVSTEGMTNDTAPKGQVLAKYYKSFFGHKVLEYAVAYYDNPNDYTDNNGEKWLTWHGDKTIEVESYIELESLTE